MGCAAGWTNRIDATELSWHLEALWLPRRAATNWQTKCSKILLLTFHLPWRQLPFRGGGGARRRETQLSDGELLAPQTYGLAVTSVMNISVLSEVRWHVLAHTDTHRLRHRLPSLWTLLLSLLQKPQTFDLHTLTHAHTVACTSGLISTPDLVKFYSLVMTVQEEAKICLLSDRIVFVQLQQYLA